MKDQRDRSSANNGRGVLLVFFFTLAVTLLCRFKIHSAKASQLLGIDRKTLYPKLKKYEDQFLTIVVHV